MSCLLGILTPLFSHLCQTIRVLLGVGILYGACSGKSSKKRLPLRNGLQIPHYPPRDYTVCGSRTCFLLVDSMGLPLDRNNHITEVVIHKN